MFTEYPRPQMRRTSFFNLNGEWILNGNPIQVPFPPQSELSAFDGKIGTHLEYEKSFTLPLEFEKALADGKRILLHFGAVDQSCSVLVDGTLVGSHEGGYLPFVFDVTKTLSVAVDPAGKQDIAEAVEPAETPKKHFLRVIATDCLDKKFPYGKQSRTSHGMWYTQVSGIWQTVWMEAVGEFYIEKIALLPKVCIENEKLSQRLKVEIEAVCAEKPTPQISARITIPAPSGTLIEKSVLLIPTKKNDFAGSRHTVECHAEFEFTEGQGFENWFPESPKLYSLKIQLESEGKIYDEVESYFALRSIRIENDRHDKDGNLLPARILLNEKPVFLNAVLDQGYHPEGIFLPENEKGFEEDILNLKKLGYNTLRKHIKVEPEIWYYCCDKNGMLVMQDMVQNGEYKFLRDTAFPTVFGSIGKFNLRATKKLARWNKTRKFFVAHTLSQIRHLYNHPCIVYWTIFNEGWGQFDTKTLYETVCKLDHSRIIDTASGWFKTTATDVESDHIYFKEIPLDARLKKIRKKGNKPLVISECGGYTLKIEGHDSSTISYGYGKCSSKEELTERIKKMYAIMIEPYEEKGLCGCVYTQLSDVENEINGLYTYDRKECKVGKLFE